MRIHTVTRTLLVVPMIALACSGATKIAYPDPAAPQSKFLASITSFPYRAPPERERTLLNAYQDITKGMRQDQVLELFGEPDAKMIEEDAKGKTIGACWSYYIAIPSNPNANPSTNDWEIVSVCFDNNGTLYYAIPLNLEGLYPIGGPAGNLWGYR